MGSLYQRGIWKRNHVRDILSVMWKNCIISSVRMMICRRKNRKRYRSNRQKTVFCVIFPRIRSICLIFRFQPGRGSTGRCFWTNRRMYCIREIRRGMKDSAGRSYTICMPPVGWTAARNRSSSVREMIICCFCCKSCLEMCGQLQWKMKHICALTGSFAAMHTVSV